VVFIGCLPFDATGVLVTCCEKAYGATIETIQTKTIFGMAHYSCRAFL
jgi:hypothetical protein